MPKLTKLYTRTGDDGITQLSSGERVPKNSARVSAFGAVDELNSHIGLAVAGGLDESLIQPLTTVQNELFHLGSDLSFRSKLEEPRPIPQIEGRHVARLENQIDNFNEQVGPLANFILPGGSQGAAHLHVARAVCRRAEREVLTLAGEEVIGSYIVPYLNRLSDLLFVMARYDNRCKNLEEPLWDSTA